MKITTVNNQDEMVRVASPDHFEAKSTERGKLICGIL